MSYLMIRKAGRMRSKSEGWKNCVSYCVKGCVGKCVLEVNNVKL